jgi:NAD(P)-dependent dehydrogenase (short-subunit alcohol dehydrogenase family)
MQNWFITGASRGLGVAIAKAALRAGDRVVAAGRQREAVVEQLGPNSEQFLSVALDVTDANQARAAVANASAKFGTIDVLVNNAGYGQLGFFEETSAADVSAQFETNLFGAFNITRAVLPLMRAARKGRIFNVSSVGGILGVQFSSLYSASKFALEGFSESLAAEVQPFGIFVTIVEPGPFRTDFLTPESLRFGGTPIADYDAGRRQIQQSFEQRTGRQPGDPDKLADAMVRLAKEPKPPLRFLAGKFAVEAVGAKLKNMQADFDSWRELSLDTDFSG